MGAGMVNYQLNYFSRNYSQVHPERIKTKKSPFGGLTAPLKPPAADVGSLRSPHIHIILYAWILRYTTIKTRSYFVRTPK